MTRRLSFAILSCCLLATWLLLNQTVSAGYLLLGGILAVCGSWLMKASPRPAGTGPRRPVAIARLFVMVLADIIRFNVAVAAIVVGLGRRQRTSGFLDIPLELRNPYGLAALACIITSTPGTFWAGFDSAGGVLTVHVLDLADEKPWIDLIKGRYERLLLEIFE